MTDLGMKHEVEFEQQVTKLGLTAPRVTPSLLDSVIVDAAYDVYFGVTTVCVLQLKNGFTVVGTSACASPDNFKEELGREIAYKDAREKIWALEGYLLKQSLYLARVEYLASQQPDPAA